MFISCGLGGLDCGLSVAVSTVLSFRLKDKSEESDRSVLLCLRLVKLAVKLVAVSVVCG